MGGSKRRMHRRRSLAHREHTTSQPFREGSSHSREENYPAHPSFERLSVWVNDLGLAERDTTHSAGTIVSEGATIAHEHGPAPSWVGSVTTEEDSAVEALKTTEKQPRPGTRKWHKIRMKQFMKTCLQKYNSEENLDEDLCFEFVKYLKESLIIEDWKIFRHFNFEAVQQGSSSVSLFFAEVIEDDGDCEVICCKILRDDDNGKCLGCRNQGNPALKHPTDTVYVGGHKDYGCPFLMDEYTDSE